MLRFPARRLIWLAASTTSVTTVSLGLAWYSSQKPRCEPIKIPNMSASQSQWLAKILPTVMLESKSDDSDTFLPKVRTFFETNPNALEQLRGSAAKLWDYVTMEEFRKLMDECQREMTDPAIYPEIEWDATVYESDELSKEERRFIQARKHHQREAFAKFIGVDTDQVECEDIPVVGIASSGGGYRAMVGYAGFLKAMKKTGALDCVMYNAGVSGSCWTLLLNYSSLIATNTDTLLEHLKNRLQVNPIDTSHLLDNIKGSSYSTKDLFQGAIRRYHQQDRETTLVDLFGLMISGVLLAGRANAAKSPELTLSSQKQYIENGSSPMPIYCAVRHDISSGCSTTKGHAENQGTENEEIVGDHGYQWFEFTPYTMGSEELNAWIPIWAFGRKFEQGKNTERLPEATFDTMIGMFGSAFAASLHHFYNEIRSLLPTGALQKADEAITRYERSMSLYHLISPACFPNPFYKLPNPNINRELSSLVDSQDLQLMDAGVDNNIPFYPLLRPGRKVDVILALDLSADIQTAPHFDRAEGYARRRGIRGWPKGAGWPHSKNDDDQQSYPLGTCTVFPSRTVGDVARNESSKEPDDHAITIVYFPFIANASFSKDFDPQTTEFCKTWNFVYTAEQVAMTAGLAEANWQDNIEQVREVLKETWERKREKRRAQH